MPAAPSIAVDALGAGAEGAAGAVAVAVVPGDGGDSHLQEGTSASKRAGPTITRAKDRSLTARP
jgi:hypothetical protein